MHSSCARRSAEYGMSAADTWSDEGLMAQLAQGQDMVLGELVQRYQNDVFRFCLHYVKNVETAKDMAQETFLRVYAARDRFDVRRKFKPWMLCIARNLCLNELKRKRDVQIETFEDFAGTARERVAKLPQTAVNTPADALIAQDRRQTLRRLLDELPDHSRELVALRYFQRIPTREIAEILESTEGAVRTRLHRVLKDLRGRCAPYREML